MAFSPVGLISSMDRALLPVRRKGHNGQGPIHGLKPDFFRFFFSRLGLTAKIMSTFISLSANIFISYISVHYNDNDEHSAVKADALVHSFLQSLATNQQEKETTASCDFDLTCFSPFYKDYLTWWELEAGLQYPLVVWLWSESAEYVVKRKTMLEPFSGT